ncbi:Ldh family oxidoreductase [bacterium]|nr:Ldh family oxidoreductase [bacterium]
MLESPEPVDQSHTFIAIDISSMMPLEQFNSRMDKLGRMIHEAPKAKGADRTWLPGEMEWEHKDRVLRDGGITLPDDVVLSLKGLAKDYNLKNVEVGFIRPEKLEEEKT